MNVQHNTMKSFSILFITIFHSRCFRAAAVVEKKIGGKVIIAVNLAIVRGLAEIQKCTGFGIQKFLKNLEFKFLKFKVEL